MTAELSLEDSPLFFGKIVDKVAGQALTAANYTLQDHDLFMKRGLFRYRKDLADHLSVYVEFQFLYYQGGPSRFRVNLLRSHGMDARSSDSEGDEITLSKLVWDDFGVRQLSGPDHWWSFISQTDLAAALLEAGKLAFGFGIPWLEGRLKPDRPATMVGQ
ncbi:MAG TPA: hypothetical protein VKQ72_18145 [Aggregatilineales bacterium]|nr:hypothetical protein [Aggregatilineales bacterium]